MDKELESASDNLSSSSSDAQQDHHAGMESLNSSDFFASSETEDTDMASKSPSYRNSFAGKALPANWKNRHVDADEVSPVTDTSQENESFSSTEKDKESHIESEVTSLQSNTEEKVTESDSPESSSAAEIVSGNPDEEKGIHGLRLPLARVKKIMKADPYLGIVSQDAVFLIAKATELFIESMASEAYEITVSSKKKTISRKDIDTIIDRIEALVFLEGAID